LEQTTKTAREIYVDVRGNPSRVSFGFGHRPVLVNIDLQNAYTRTDRYRTAYETHPEQLSLVNHLAAAFRVLGLPVVWTSVAYMSSGEDAGVWGTRTNTPDSLQNIKVGSDRAALDERLELDRDRDVFLLKRMPSAFFETSLASLLVWHRTDTVVLTGGSTSGCVRATAVDSLSHGYRTVVVEECVADKHESYHYANLTDLLLKYADVLPVGDVLAHLDRLVQVPHAR
jgi:maleamate amidohydrolase